MIVHLFAFDSFLETINRTGILAYPLGLQSNLHPAMKYMKSIWYFNGIKWMAYNNLGYSTSRATDHINTRFFHHSQSPSLSIGYLMVDSYWLKGDVMSSLFNNLSQIPLLATWPLYIPTVLSSTF